MAPQPLPPYVVPVGPLSDASLRPTPPLSAELIQWLDEAVEQNIPVVLLSTGSNARFPADELAVVVRCERGGPALLNAEML